ncbi:MAG: CpcT/CpeT family chromophore lyase [Microcystaceae cyanobacterium]
MKGDRFWDRDFEKRDRSRILMLAIVAPPLSRQVQQVAQWFSGFFNNAEQVTENPSVPFVSISNCPVQVLGETPPAQNLQSIYLEQATGGFPFRVRYYAFTQGQQAVNLSVYAFNNPSSLIGLCARPQSQRTLDVSTSLT